MYKVLKVGEPKMIKTAKGEKLIVNLYVQDETGGTKGVDVLGLDTARGVKVGSSIEIANIKPREYNGKTYYSCNNKDVTFGTPAAPTTAPVKQEAKTDWVQKDKLTQRSICLSYANELAKNRLDMSVADILTAAETYTQWIYTQWIYAEPPATVANPDGPVDDEIGFD